MKTMQRYFWHRLFFGLFLSSSPPIPAVLMLLLPVSISKNQPFIRFYLRNSGQILILIYRFPGVGADAHPALRGFFLHFAHQGMLISFIPQPGERQ
jgi:hypothetical protein